MEAQEKTMNTWVKANHETNFINKTIVCPFLHSPLYRVGEIEDEDERVSRDREAVGGGYRGLPWMNFAFLLRPGRHVGEITWNSDYFSVIMIR